jgi:hypothetical protein
MPLTREQTKYVPSNDTVFLPTVAIDNNLGVRGNALFNGNISVNGSATFGSIIRNNGASNQYLMADGSVTTLINTVFPTQVQVTLANNIVTGGGQLYLNGANGNRIDFNQNGVGAPTVTNRSAGTKIVLYPALTGSAVDYAMGIDSATFWQSVDTISASFKWYAGSAQVASLTGAGLFTAVSKSFDIQHPTKPDMRLRYGSLEGPENGVYIRGKSKEKIIVLPDYWTGLVHEDSVTAQLTAIGTGTIYVDLVENNSIKIGGTAEEFFYLIQAERKDIDKLTVEY